MKLKDLPSGGFFVALTLPRSDLLEGESPTIAF